jgi:hypothetical protein
MWKLERPSHSARQTFTTCISRVRDRGLKSRLEGVTQDVENASVEYDAAAQIQSLQQIVRSSVVGADITRQEMEAVYTQRMVPENSPGRDIYNDLISIARGRCPLCGHGSVTTLDHMLPKVHYPALSVVPLNLVPSCADCNKAKLNSFPAAAEEVTIHPYYDNIDDHRWLQAEIVMTQPAALRFKVNPSGFWDPILRQRVLNHFQLFGLATLYGCQSAEELLHIRYQLIELYQAGGPGEVKLWLKDREVSCEKARRNSWRTAAYEAWAASDWFCDGGFASAG